MPTQADFGRGRRTRVTLVLAYAALSIGWILVSDGLLELLPASLHEGAASAKGIAYVLVAGTLLWGVMLVRDLRVERERAVGLAEMTARIAADEHQRRLAGAIEATPLGVAVLTHKADRFDIAYANEALADLMRIPAANLVGADPFAYAGLFGPDAAKGLAGRLATGEPFESDTTLIPRDGEPTAVRVLVSPVAERDDPVASVVLIVLDRREAAAREAAEARLGTVLGASPVPIVATDGQGHVTEWNPAAERAFGWRSDEVVGQPMPLLPADGDGRHDALAVRIAAGEAPAPVELELLHRDGHRVPCRLQASPLRTGGGAGSGVVMAIEDLSPLIEQQHAQAQLASAIHAAGEAILITDLEGAITYVNPAFERVSGYRHDELIGRNPRILQSGRTSASVYADLWGRLRSGQAWRGVLVNKRKDGSLFEEEATLSPVFGSDGGAIAYVGVKRDLTLERTLSAGLATELNDRAAVQETMARLDLGESPEEMAQLLCQALASFPDVNAAVLERLPPGDGPAVVIGAAGDAVGAVQIGDAQDAARSARLRLRATSGAWSSLEAGNVPPPFPAGAVPPSLPAFAIDGLTTVAAPVRHRGRPVAMLHLGARAEAPDAWVARYLRIASELAAHVGPLLGPALGGWDGHAAAATEIDAPSAAGAGAAGRILG